MSTRYALVLAGLVAGIGSLVLPALAQTQDYATNPADRHMGRTVMDGMMSRGCAGMVPSMSRGDGRPNSQWQ